MQSPIIHISKIETAKRQLETAINLFFLYKDTISIHTLASAAYDVLKDLCEVRGIKNYIVKNTDLIKIEHRKAYRDIINKAQNFFKHANNDPQDVLEFRPEVTEYFIWDATHMYSQITNEHPEYFILFRIWFLSKNPDNIAIYPGGSKESIFQLIKVFKLDPNNRTTYLNLMPTIMQSMNLIKR